MSSNKRVAVAVRNALLMGAITTVGVAAPVWAADNAGDDFEVVVTGSRIKIANLESTSPVTQVTAEDVVTQGVTRVEDLVNQLPQAFAAQNATVANGASGTATVNLRGLGSSRTLVLVDGRRMSYGGVGSSAADLNQIPTQMVERVEVLTGGASAVYGSDAVAGVVNFIMKRDYEGVEVSGQYNFYQHKNDFGGPGATSLRQVIAARSATNPAQFQLPPKNVTDGYGKEASILMGMNSADGKGNITLYATAFDGSEILQRDRDFSACSLGSAVGSFTCGGSSTNATGRFTDFGTAARILGPGATSFNFTSNGAGGWRNFSSSLDQYNFGPLNHYLRPERRYTLGATGHYEVSDKADIYAQVMYTDYRSVAQIAPSGDFLETSTINCGNPFLPAANLLAINCTPARVAANESVPFYIGRRNVEGGGRQSAFNNASFRTVVGVRGNLSDAWSYDVSAQVSGVKATNTAKNYFSIERLSRALNVVNVNGTPTCQSVIDGTDKNCVPWNPFTAGGVTQAALNYLSVTGLQIGQIQQEDFTATLAGDLGSYGVKTPWANDGVQTVFGVEYRRDSLQNTVDANQQAGDLAGSGGATFGIDGSTRVNELFFEGKLPIAQDQAWAQSLSADVAYRYSDYAQGFQTDTYKAGIEWAPVQDIRFRASYGRAVRAPNIIELFSATTLSLFDMDGDPCGASAPNANASAAECIATGVPASLVGLDVLDSPAGQYQVQVGGNPNVKPETSDTVTFGVVLQPRFIENLSITLDYFNIKIDGTISTFGAQNTLDACYNNGNADACSRIHRSRGGSIWSGGGYVTNTNINIGSLKTKGLDVSADYSYEIGSWGSLSANLAGTYLKSLAVEPGTGGDNYDCVGYFAGPCGTPNPKWRHKARLSWQTPWDVDLSLTWRFYGAVTGLAAANVELPANRIDRKFAAENYFDVAASWAVTKKASLILGINNVLDDNPQINASVGTTGNGNTYPQTYDALGRYVFARASYKF